MEEFGKKFGENLEDFYKILSPIDDTGKFVIDSRLGAAASSGKRENIDASASDWIKKSVIDEFHTGKELIKIKNLNPKALIKSPEGREYKLLEAAVTGIFNVIYQPQRSPLSEALYTPYFASESKQSATPKAAAPAKPAKPTPPATKPSKPAKPAESKTPDVREQRVTNYYGQVCDVSPEDVSPPLNYSMIFLRSPMLSKTREKSDVVQLYLTSMPPTFASQLTPYCDLEFQLPVLKNHEEDPRVNRSSLYRFLMGSGKKISELSEADKSIANVLEGNPKKMGRFQAADKRQTFAGMELFMTPQTLVNMDTLKASNNEGFARLNDVKPFLPPATLESVGISMRNAGAGTFSTTSANVKFKIHDKKRLVEFSDYFRADDGYNRTTVWITYGMISNRNNGEQDLYSKFINENMLQRLAFSVQAAQYSFEADGSCSVTLTLRAKGGVRVENTPISFSNISVIGRQFQDAVKEINDNISGLGTAEKTVESGFLQSEIRIAQAIQSAASGIVPTSAEEITKIKEDAKFVKDLFESNRTIGGPGYNKTVAIELIDKLLLSIDKYGSLKNTARSYASNKLQKLTFEKDPFLPRPEKNDITFHTSLAKNHKDFIAAVVKKNPDAIKYYDENLCKETQEPDAFASFGKIFSSFCVPSILNAMKDELGVPDTGKEINNYEVQFIFYQLNNHCGPISCHNIAEFPMDVALFTESFSNLMESSIGGSEITLDKMFSFLNGQLQDPRQPGYGKRTFYKKFVTPNPGEAAKIEFEGDENAFSNKMKDWSEKYGPTFVTPVITVQLETRYEDTTGSKDILFDLSRRAGGDWQENRIEDSRKAVDDKKKVILRYHIYDKTCSPFDKITKAVRLSDTGNYYVLESNYADESKLLTALNSNPTQKLPEGFSKLGGDIIHQGKVIGASLGRGKEALLNYLGQFVPRLQVGTEGSLIKSINITTNPNASAATIAMQGGARNRASGLTETGLTNSQFNLPMIVYASRLQMTTVGCPLAKINQHFFIDFETNTTLDNDYVVIEINHNISQGKFETSWGLSYYDGYGRMIAGNSISTQVEKIKKAAEQAAQKAPATTAPAKPPNKG